MAKNEDYIPNTNGELRAYLENFNTKLPLQAATLGFSAGEVAAIVAENTALITAIDKVEQARHDLKVAAATKKMLRKAFDKSFRTTANRMKGAHNYTETIGKGLGITGKEKSWDKDTARPSLKAVMLGSGEVLLKFKKAKSKGVQIWCKRGNEAHFSVLGRYMRSPIHDKRPNLVEGVPERRIYYAYYFIDDEAPVGQQSALVEVYG